MTSGHPRAHPMTDGTRLARVSSVRLAAIDVGSNSVHLVIADVSADGRVEVVDRVKEMVRLGRRTFTTGRLPRAAMDLAVGAVKTFARLARARRVVRVRAVATSAVREARNGLTFVRPGGAARVIGTSGTVNTLVAMAAGARGQDPARLHGAHATAREVTRVRRRVLALPAGRRAELPGMDAKRVDLMPAAAVLVDLVLARTGAPQLMACAWALREGVLLDLAGVRRDPMAGAEYDRQRAVEALAARFVGANAHGRHVARLALALFDGTAAALGLPATARELLHHAALLHDIGHAIEHNRHHHHSCYLIRNAELVAFDPLEIEIMAQVARGHRKQIPKLADPELRVLPGAARRVVRALAALLRTADGLDREQLRVVRRLAVTLSRARLVIEVEADGDEAELDLWAADRRAELLGRLLDRPVVLRRTRRGAAALPQLRASGAS